MLGGPSRELVGQGSRAGRGRDDGCEEEAGSSCSVARQASVCLSAGLTRPGSPHLAASTSSYICAVVPSHRRRPCRSHRSHRAISYMVILLLSRKKERILPSATSLPTRAQQEWHDSPAIMQSHRHPRAEGCTAIGEQDAGRAVAAAVL